MIKVKIPSDMKVRNINQLCMKALDNTFVLSKEFSLFMALILFLIMPVNVCKGQEYIGALTGVELIGGTYSNGFENASFSLVRTWSTGFDSMYDFVDGTEGIELKTKASGGGVVESQEVHFQVFPVDVGCAIGTIDSVVLSF